MQCEVLSGTALKRPRVKSLLSKERAGPSVCRLLGSGAEQLAPHVTHDEIIMMRASSGARRLHAISTRPASTAASAVFKDSLSFSTVYKTRALQG